jgi:hypothetical protein
MFQALPSTTWFAHVRETIFLAYTRLEQIQCFFLIAKNRKKIQNKPLKIARFTYMVQIRIQKYTRMFRFFSFNTSFLAKFG